MNNLFARWQTQTTLHHTMEEGPVQFNFAHVYFFTTRRTLLWAGLTVSRKVTQKKGLWSEHSVQRLNSLNFFDAKSDLSLKARRKTMSDSFLKRLNERILQNNKNIQLA